MEKMEICEMVSALADGQLQGEAFAIGMHKMATDSTAQQTWQTYHLIGDVLRSAELAAGTAPSVFLRGVLPLLSREPSFATDSIASHAHPARAAGLFPSFQPAANAASFRWKALAGLASLAAVAALGWAAISGIGAKPEQAQLAAAPGADGTLLAAGSARGRGDALQAAGQGAMIRDARLDELLAAHRQLGGASALQMPAGFLRNATFETPAR